MRYIEGNLYDILKCLPNIFKILIFSFYVDKKPIFGQTPSIFGNAANSLNKAADSATPENDKPKTIFGGIGGSAGSGSIFGGKSVFGSASSSIFDGKSSGNDTTKSVFDSSKNSTPDTIGGGTSIFGSSTFSGFGNATSMQGSIFGGGNNSNTSKPNTEGNIFGVIPKEQTVAAPSFADLSNKAGVTDFASLAAKANSANTNRSLEKAGPGGFIGLTDENAFSSFSKSAQNTSNDGNANDSAKNDDNENYDPHYDPIIALPDEIQVSTGEEDETKLFGERATLYRYDANTKEWKERGKNYIIRTLNSFSRK